jgi:hypothetical protein
MAKLMSVLAPRAPDANGAGTDEDASLESINEKFKDILSSIRSSDLTERERAFISTEANLLLEDARQQGGLRNIVNSSAGRKQALELSRAKTSIYSEATGPICLVYGGGPVGQAVYAKLKSLGKAIQLRVIDADALGVVQESEINYAVRDARSIIVAADAKTAEKKSSWFGDKTENEMSFVVNEKSLKR